MVQKIYFFADKTNPRAVKAQAFLTDKYWEQTVSRIDDADVIVSLGGDGTALVALRQGLKHGKKVYGMNLGHVGAYQNKYSCESLQERLDAAIPLTLNPLTMTAETVDGKKINAVAWNEVYLRSGNNPQQARFIGQTEGIERPFQVAGDGHLIATPFGSTAYNLAAGGYKLGYKEQLLASTSIAAARGVQDILPNTTHFHLSVSQPEKRSVSAFADNQFLGIVKSCDVFQDFSKSVVLLLDAEKEKQLEKNAQAIRRSRETKVENALTLQGLYKHAYTRR